MLRRPTMKWFEAAIIFLCVIYGEFIGSQSDFSLFGRLVLGLVSGLIVGWAIVGLLRLLLWLARLFSKKMPGIAFYVGAGLFWLGMAIGIFCVGLAGYIAYEGASLRLVGYILGFSVFYFAIGWGFRYALRPN